MKNYLFTILGILCLFSCTSDDEKREEITYLRIPDNIKMLHYTQPSQYVQFTIETNSRDWTVESNQEEWCYVKRISSNDQMFILTLKENETTNTREAKLTFKMQGTVETITVKQIGTSPVILINPETIDQLESTGSKIPLKITTNVKEYLIDIPEEAKNWISIQKPAKVRAMETYDYVMEVESNTGLTDREAIITVKGVNEETEVSATLTVSQKEPKVNIGDIVPEEDIKLIPMGAKDNQHHAGQGIENTFDGKIGGGSAPYHSPWATDYPTTKLPIILEYEFDGSQNIDYIVYYPNGGNGDFGQLKLYTANQDNDTYVLEGEYDFKFSRTPSKIMLKQPLQKATKVKFEISSGVSGYVSCSEMEFCQINEDNKLEKQLLTVFKDITCSELRSDITTETINALPAYFSDLAKRIERNLMSDWEKRFRIQTYEAYSEPEVWATKIMTKIYGNLDNPTGIYVQEGEELLVLVGDTYGQKISLQSIDEEGSGKEIQPAATGYTYFLKQGVNKKKMNGKGQLFVMYNTDITMPNAKPVKIHIPYGCGTVTGFFDLKQDKTDMKYEEYLRKATHKYFCIRGERIMFYFHLNKLRQYVQTTILPAINLWDNFIYWQHELMGLEDIYHKQFNNHVFAISPEYSYMWQANYRIGFVYTYLDNILLPENVMAVEDNAWGPAHEIGHINQSAINWAGSSESSNNLFSNYTIYKLGKYKSRGRGLCKVADARYKDGDAWWNMGDATHQNEDTEVHLRMNWQLWTYYHRCGIKPNFWPTLFKLLREPGNRVADSSPGSKQIMFAKLASQAAGEDLSDFFAQWGFFEPVSTNIEQYGSFYYMVTTYMIEEAQKFMHKYPKPKHALQYIEDRRKTDFESSDFRSTEVGDIGYWETFKNNTKITMTPNYTVSGDKITVENGSQAVAFECRAGDKNSKLLYFANSFTFSLPGDVSLSTSKLYAVQADGERIEMRKK